MMLDYSKIALCAGLFFSLVDVRYSHAEKVYSFDDYARISLLELLPVWLNHGGSIDIINSDIPDDRLQSGESPFDHKRKRDDFIGEIVEQANRLKGFSQFNFVASIDGNRAEYDFDKGVMNICLPQFAVLDRGFDYGILMSSDFLSEIGVGRSDPILILSYRGVMIKDQGCRSGSSANGQSWFSRARVSVPVDDVNEAERLFNQINSGALEVSFSLIPESRANLLPLVAEVTSVVLLAPDGAGGFSRKEELVNLDGKWRLINGTDQSDDDRTVSFDVGPILDILGTGVWSGLAEQANGSSFEVILKVNGQEISISQPKFDCEETLDSGIRVGKTYAFNANPRVEHNECARGIEFFEVQENGTVIWRWRGLNSMQDSSQAILTMK